MMPDWVFWALVGYVVVGALWFGFCVVGWLDLRGWRPKDSQWWAWMATRAPFWPFYFVRGVSRGLGALFVDAVKGRG